MKFNIKLIIFFIIAYALGYLSAVEFNKKNEVTAIPKSKDFSESLADQGLVRKKTDSVSQKDKTKPSLEDESLTASDGQTNDNQIETESTLIMT